MQMLQELPGASELQNYKWQGIKPPSRIVSTGDPINEITNKSAYKNEIQQSENSEGDVSAPYDNSSDGEYYEVEEENEKEEEEEDDDFM
jgi:hypothetical protein